MGIKQVKQILTFNFKYFYEIIFSDFVLNFLILGRFAN